MNARCRAPHCHRTQRGAGGYCWSHNRMQRAGLPLTAPPQHRRGGAVELPDPSWMDAAACLGHDPEDWFPADRRTAARAAGICHGCPVIADCDRAANAIPRLDRWGIWAGVWWWDGGVRRIW